MPPWQSARFQSHMVTWLHGIFDADALRHAWLNQCAEQFSLPHVERISYAPQRDVERLADAVEENLDVGRLLALVQQHKKTG